MNFEVWPGPMEGVGRGEFVRAAVKLKLTACWMTPFIRISDNIPSAGKLFRSIGAYLDSGMPVTVQLMGSSPELLARGAEIIAGHSAVSGINLNFGCPSSRVLKHGSGGAMLKNPGILGAFCRTVAENLPEKKISVKIRSGFFDADECNEIIPALIGSGVVDKVFFHYRSVMENYSPKPLRLREERIRRAVELCGNIPLIANGDISSVSESEKLVAVTGAAGVMIARPWLRDPYLLNRFIDPDLPDAEEGRIQFFNKLQDSGISGGALIELAKLLWGSNSAEFKKLLTDNA